MNNNYFDALEKIYSTAFDLTQWKNTLITEKKSYIEIPEPSFSLPNMINEFNGQPGDYSTEISSHLPHAAKISQVLSAQIAKISIAEYAFENISYAAVILDDIGNIIRLNQQARQIGDGIQISTSSIEITRNRDAKKFQNLIQQALFSRKNKANTDIKSLSLLRPSGKRPYFVSISPFPAYPENIISSEPALLVVFLDSDKCLSPLMDILKQNYKLSKRESELTVKLCEGITLPNIAKAMSITYETARSMIKRIFKKTNCKNQVTLVRMILTLPAQSQEFLTK